jgi:hypothetical protein
MTVERGPARTEGVETARGAGAQPVPAPRAAQGAKAGPDCLCAEYLRRSRGHLRKSVIAFACVNQVMALPAADAELFGQPIAGPLGLRPAAAVVHGILRQDRSMAAWAARDCVVLLDALLRSMGGSRADAVDTMLAAAGLRHGPAIDPVQVAGLPFRVRAEVLRLARRVRAMFFGLQCADSHCGPDRAFYQRLFAARSMSAALLAHDIAAWAGIVTGRLLHTGYLDEMPWMSPEFSSVPAMSAPGWYPNPFQMGEIVLGEASCQRFWDGADWTDRVRVRGQQGWCECTKSMYEAPPN